MKKLSLYLLIAVIITALICVSGCTSEKTAPTTTIQYDVVVPVETVSDVNIDGVSYPSPYISNADPRITHDIQTVNSVQTYTVKSVNIDSTGKSNWVKYTNYEDRFSIYKPWDWEVEAIDRSGVSYDGGVTEPLMMDETVFIYTPNLKGFIMIYGMDFSGTLFSLFEDPEKTQISDEFYDSFVQGIKSGETEQMKFTSFVKDSNYYLINENPARRVTVYSQIGEETLHGDAYIIAHENSYYVEMYFAMVGSTQYDATTASTIMQTFTVL